MLVLDRNLRPQLFRTQHVRLWSQSEGRPYPIRHASRHTRQRGHHVGPCVRRSRVDRCRSGAYDEPTLPRLSLLNPSCLHLNATRAPHFHWQCMPSTSGVRKTQAFREYNNKTWGNWTTGRSLWHYLENMKRGVLCQQLMRPMRNPLENNDIHL